VMRGQPAGVPLSGFGRAARRREVSGDFEFVWTEHGLFRPLQESNSSHNKLAEYFTLRPFGSANGAEPEDDTGLRQDHG